LDRLLAVMVDVFHTSRTNLSATSEADDIPDWDSLRTIHLAIAVEAEFGVSLTPDEIAGLLSVPVILEVLASKGVA